MTSPGRVRWALVGWLCVLSTIAYLDRVNIAVAGQTIAREYHSVECAARVVVQRAAARAMRRFRRLGDGRRTGSARAAS